MVTCLHRLLGELCGVGEGNELHQAFDELCRAALGLLRLLHWVLTYKRDNRVKTEPQSQPLNI